MKLAMNVVVITVLVMMGPVRTATLCGYVVMLGMRSVVHVYMTMSLKLHRT